MFLKGLAKLNNIEGKTHVADDVQVAVDAVVVVSDGSGFPWSWRGAVDDLLRSCNNMVGRGEVEGASDGLATLVLPPNRRSSDAAGQGSGEEKPNSLHVDWMCLGNWVMPLSREGVVASLFCLGTALIL